MKGSKCDIGMDQIEFTLDLDQLPEVAPPTFAPQNS